MQVAIQAQPAQVETVDPIADPRYDQFVAGHERATAYHAGAWARILRSAYGFKPAYLALPGPDGGLDGVLPLMYSRGLLSGRRLRSLPVVPTAGPLAVSAEKEAALLEAACRLADERGGRLIVNSRGQGYESSVPGLKGTQKNPTWITPLPADADELRASWKKRSNNLFRSIAKSEKAGVSIREGDSEADLRVFYRLYLETMKRHRTLPRGWRQVAMDRDLLGPSGVFRLFVAEHEERPVAAGVFHAYGDTVDLLYNGSDNRERDLRANFGLYWHAVRWAIEHGFKQFDWGEAQEGGTLSRFKAQWSAEPVAQYGYDYTPGAGPDAGLSRADRMRHGHDRIDNADVPMSRRDKLVAGAYDRVPTSVTRFAGAALYRLF
jgi:hypothetical protein